MTGQFARADEWAEIRSVAEGHFMERFTAGAFVKTIREGAARMKVMYHHGKDPYFGNSLLGPVRSLETDTSYEVDLLDTDYNKRLVPQLRAGLLGSSFRFDIVKEDVTDRPERSDRNPDGIPEVTITEARVAEFGPTPTPYYTGTTAGLRSITDEFLLAELQADPARLVLLAGAIRAAALNEPEQPPHDGTPSVVEPQHSQADTTTQEVRPSWFLEY